ncbi:MAG: MFS transporter [Anaerolineae bacterium]|jgi:MFS family permease|nr:MFS transporter [Anaerolineae bacterium]
MRAFWFDSLLASMSDAFWANYSSLYVLSLGGTRTQVGWMSSASSFAGMLMPVPGAALTRRVGQRRQMVVVFSVLFRIMFLLAALAPLVVRRPAVIWVVMAFFVLRAGLLNTFTPAWLSLTRDIVPQEHRGRYFSSRNLMQAITTMLMVPLAGAIIETAGEPVGYQIALGIAFCVGLAASYAFSRIPEQRRSAVRRASVAEQVRSLWQAVTRSRPFLVFILIRILFDLGLMVGGPYFTTFQVEVLQSPASTIGLLVTLRSFTRMIGLRFWGRLLDQRGARWVITAACLFIPALPMVYTVASRPWHIAFVDVPSGFLFAGYELAAFALMLELLEGEDNTQAAAGYMTLSSAVSIAGPLIGGWLISRFGYSGDFVVSGAIRAAAAILFLVTFKPFGTRRVRST